MNRDLSQEMLKKKYHYNPDTGIFFSLKKNKSVGTRVGKYLVLRINRRNYLCHRLAFLYMTGFFPFNIVDHINRNPSDNRWKNLRAADHAINLANGKRKNKTGYRGVVKTRGRRFRAKMKCNGKMVCLGFYRTAKEAGDAYKMAVINLFGPNVCFEVQSP